MKFLDDAIALLTAACQAGSSACVLAVARTARKICLMAGLFVVAVALLLGALGLMVAALFFGLMPYMGMHWVAMIAAAAALAGSGLFLAIALKVSKAR